MLLSKAIQIVRPLLLLMSFAKILTSPEADSGTMTPLPSSAEFSISNPDTVDLVDNVIGGALRGFISGLRVDK